MAISFKASPALVAEKPKTEIIELDTDEILMAAPSESSMFGEMAIARLYASLGTQGIEGIKSLDSLDAIMDFTLLRRLELVERFREDGISTDAKRAEAYSMALTGLEDNVLKRRKLKQDEDQGGQDSAITGALLNVLKNVTPSLGRLEQSIGTTLPDLPAETEFKFNEAEMIVGLDDRSNERA